jgi:hypothetical protein
MWKKIFPWRHAKKNDCEGRSSMVKKERKLHNWVPVRIDVTVTWDLYNNMRTCKGWGNVHLLDRWLHRRVPIPPVPRSDWGCDAMRSSLGGPCYRRISSVIPCTL